jgi:hypothetical protein
MKLPLLMLAADGACTEPKQKHILSQMCVCCGLPASCGCGLAGAACSNVFDGSRQFGCDGSSDSHGTQQAGAAAEDSHVLMGVTSQARVGLLTLFEWYRYVEVRISISIEILSIAANAHIVKPMRAASFSELDSVQLSL